MPLYWLMSQESQWNSLSCNRLFKIRQHNTNNPVYCAISYYLPWLREKFNKSCQGSFPSFSLSGGCCSTPSFAKYNSKSASSSVGRLEILEMLVLEVLLGLLGILRLLGTVGLILGLLGILDMGKGRRDGTRIFAARGLYATIWKCRSPVCTSAANSICSTKCISSSPETGSAMTYLYNLLDSSLPKLKSSHTFLNQCDLILMKIFWANHARVVDCWQESWVVIGA